MSLYNTNPHNFLLSLHKRLGKVLYNKNFISSQDLNTNVITNIIYHEKTRIVITFKELLIYDDQNECLKRFYFLKESPYKLKNLFEFYETNSKIFPNYCPLPESKYLFKNIKKKQKILDNIEMEENQEHNNNNNSNNNSSQMYNHDNNKQRDVFTSYIMYSLLSCDNLSSSHTHNSSSVLKLINEIQTNECVDNNNCVVYESKCKYNIGVNSKRGNSSKHHKKFIKDNNYLVKGEGCVVNRNGGNNCNNVNCNSSIKKNDTCSHARGVLVANSKNIKKVIDSGNIINKNNTNNINVNYESADKGTPMRKVINQRIKILETKSKTSNHVVVSSSTSKSKKVNNNNTKNINTNIHIQRFNPHLHSKHSPSQKVQISLCNITTSKSKSKSKSKSNSKPKGTLPLSEQNNIKLSTHNAKYSNRIIIKKQTITTSQSKSKEAKSMPKLSYKERLNSLNKLSKNAITIESKRITSPQATISSNIIKFKQKTPDNPQFKQTQVNEPSHHQQGTKVQTIIKTTLSKNTNNSNSSNALNSNTKSTTSKKSNIKTKYTNYNANIVKEKKIPSLHISFSKHYSSTGNKSKSKSKSPNDNNEHKHIQKQSKVTGSKCFNNNNNLNSNNNNNQIKNSCLIKQNNLRTLIHKDILTNSEDGRLTERLSNHKSINLIKTTFATISSKSKQHNKISNNTKHHLNTHKKITSSDECNFNQHQPKTARVPSYKKNNNNKQTQIQQRTINNNTSSQQRVFSASNKKNEKVTQVNSTTTSTTITKRVQTSRGNSSNNNTKNTLYVNSNTNTNTNSTMKKKQIVKKINNFNEIVNSISTNINPRSRSTNMFISPRSINTNKSINLKRK